MARIDLRGIAHSYARGPAPEASYALKPLDHTLEDGGAYALLGPSGCGKTTLLRIIAGFEEVSGGKVVLFGDEIEQLPPNKRPVNTVFQHYALFPHMTVEENIAFGLKRLSRDKAEIRRRVGEMMEITRLGTFAGRRQSVRMSQTLPGMKASC